jgi:hypothetical protein
LQIKKTQTNEDSDECKDHKHEDQSDECKDHKHEDQSDECKDHKHEDQSDECKDHKHEDQGDEAVLRNSNTVSTNLYILDHKFVYIGSQICIHWITNLYLLPGVQD